MTDPTEARIAEAETQCLHERAARVQLAVLVAGFIQRAAPLVADAGVSVELEAPATEDNG